MKRILTSIFTLIMVFTFSAPAFGAENTATTLRLESTEGTVTLTSQSGKTLSKKDGMKLSSGSSLTTGKSSYAYVSLDDTKVSKLDASSSVTIKKSKKKLELLVESGNLFFNVKEPLKADETMEIRTSTMVTGVRGTSGYVKLWMPTLPTLHSSRERFPVYPLIPLPALLKRCVFTQGKLPLSQRSLQLRSIALQS